MLAEAQRAAPHGVHGVHGVLVHGVPAPAFVLDHHRMLDQLAHPHSAPRSPRLGVAAKTAMASMAGSANSSSGGSTGGRHQSLGQRPVQRPVFDLVRTAGGRPLSLPYAVDHHGGGLQGLHHGHYHHHHHHHLARPSPPPSLLDSLSLTEEAEGLDGDQDGSPAASLLDSPRLTPSSSLMDSSSLARMARLRQPPAPGLGLLDSYQTLPAIKRGVLWQQRERLWSRWKERYFVLTSDYLHCFKRRAANDGLSQMGHFIFKIRLVDLDAVEWVNRRSYSVVALSTRDRPRVLLRAAHGLEDWFELLEECTLASKERRRALYERRQPCDWNGSLQREGSLSSMSPGVEALLRRRLEEQEHEQEERGRDPDDPDREAERAERQRAQERDDRWRPPSLQRKPHAALAEPDESLAPAAPPSLPATYRAAPRPRAGLAGPPPPVPPPAPPAPASTPAGCGACHGPCHHSAAARRQPVYHRLNPDVFFMAADRPAGDTMSWRSRDFRHTQV